MGTSLGIRSLPSSSSTSTSTSWGPSSRAHPRGLAPRPSLSPGSAPRSLAPNPEAAAGAFRPLVMAWRRGHGGGLERRRKDDEEEVVRTLLIDNHDSYTYNIYQELSVVNGGEMSSPLSPDLFLFFCFVNTSVLSSILESQEIDSISSSPSKDCFFPFFFFLIWLSGW